MNNNIFSKEDAIKHISDANNRSISIMKKHADIQEKLSKEARDWMINLTTISTAFLIAFRGTDILNNVFLIFSFVLFIIVIIITVSHKIYAVQKMQLNLFDSHKKVQDYLNGEIKIYKQYIGSSKEECFSKIMQKVEELPRNEVKELKIDKWIIISAVLFVLSLILLVVSVFVGNVQCQS